MAKKARKKKSKTAAAKATAAAPPSPAMPALKIVGKGAGEIDDDLAASMQRTALGGGSVSASTGQKLDTLPIEILETILKPGELGLSAFLDLKRVSRSFASIIKGISSRTTVQHTLGDWQRSNSLALAPSQKSAMLTLRNPRTTSQVSAEISGEFKIIDIEALMNTWREAGRSTPWALGGQGSDFRDKFFDSVPWESVGSMAICFDRTDLAHLDLFNSLVDMGLRKPFADGAKKAKNLNELTLISVPCDFIDSTMVAKMRESLQFLRLVGQPILPTCTLCPTSPLRDLVAQVPSIMITSAYIRGRTEEDLTAVLLQAQDSLETLDVCISGHLHGRQHNVETAIAANVQSVHMEKLEWFRLLLRDTVEPQLQPLQVSFIAPKLETVHLSAGSIGWLRHSSAGLASATTLCIDLTPGNLLVHPDMITTLRRCTALHCLTIDMSTDDGSDNRAAIAPLQAILRNIAFAPQIPLHHICIKSCTSWDGSDLHGLLVARIHMALASLVCCPIMRLCVHGHSFSRDVALMLPDHVGDCRLEAAEID